MLAAAANLLILFGRLRTQMVEMEAVPLMEYVTREIEGFEENCLKAGIDPHETQVAKYLLCGTADDIVQNIPGTDRHIWVQYSMVARFFNRRTSGVGFFQEVEKALQAPAQRFQLLELALTCLSLGFEGQYRSAPNGAVELARIRGMIYESLRRVQNRPDEDISPRWQPVDVGGRRRFGGTPLWVIGSVLGMALMGAYFGLSMMISGEGSAVSQRLLTINPTGQVSLVRTVAFTPLEVDQAELVQTGQLDRIKEGMAKDIADGLVEVDVKGEFIFIRVNNAALFASGKADTKPEFNDLGARITTALNAEPGPVYIFGYTDNVPMSGRGRFKNNHDLSLARAEAVKAVLATGMTDPERFVVEGKGEADPIGDNEAEDGRALNRRVEIMIKREETLQ
jgi:type VI secretion system protein ImpK